MQSKRRLSPARAARLERIAEDLVRGYTQRQIAERHAVSIGTVNADVALIHEIWIERTAIDADIWKAQLVEGHMATLREAWEAWERSKQQSKRTAVKSARPKIPPKRQDGTYDNSLTPAEQAIVIEEQTGDPRYLALATKALDSISKLLGIGGDAAASLQVRRLVEREASELGLDVDVLFDEISHYLTNAEV